ncbi:putative transposase [Thermus phage phiLo]|nr:putative transposase [Thermus phage phiLo]
MARLKKETTFIGVNALLIFPSEEDREATLDLMRRFSSAVRYAYNRLLEGVPESELWKVDGPIGKKFGLGSRYITSAILKAKSTIDTVKATGRNPKKVIFGGRALFEQIKRNHLTGRGMERLKREWKERRQGTVYSRGSKGTKGNPSLRLVVEEGALKLRIKTGEKKYTWALVKTSHPNLSALLKRVYASDYYNVELSLKDGKVYANFSWKEELPTPVYTKENGVLGVDINADPYNLALVVVGPDGNLKRYLTISLEEVDRAPNKGVKEIVLWNIAHRIVSLAEEYGVALATEKLKYLQKSRRGDGSGRAFRRKQHRFAYASILRKLHSLAKKRGVEVVEVNPANTSIIGSLKYAPLMSLSKDVAAAYVIGRRALGFEEKLPKNYEKLLQDEDFRGYVQSFYSSRVEELSKKREKERNPYIKNRLSRELGKSKDYLNLFSSSHGSPGSQREVTDGRNSPGVNPWRVLRVGTFLPLLGREVPRDLSPLKPILFRGSWEGWKGSSGPPPGWGAV